jgi:hypothetical protein
MAGLLHQVVAQLVPRLARRGHKNKPLQRRRRSSARRIEVNLPAAHAPMRRVPGEAHDQHSRSRRNCGMIASGRL